MIIIIGWSVISTWLICSTLLYISVLPLLNYFILICPFIVHQMCCLCPLVLCWRVSLVHICCFDCFCALVALVVSLLLGLALLEYFVYWLLIFFSSWNAGIARIFYFFERLVELLSVDFRVELSISIFVCISLSIKSSELLDDSYCLFADCLLGSLWLSWYWLFISFSNMSMSSSSGGSDSSLSSLELDWLMYWYIPISKGGSFFYW